VDSFLLRSRWWWRVVVPATLVTAIAPQPESSQATHFPGSMPLCKTPTPFDYQGSPGKTNFQLSDNLDFTVTDEGLATGVDYSVSVTCKASF
jgi:hypothetical protein